MGCVRGWKVQAEAESIELFSHGSKLCLSGAILLMNLRQFHFEIASKILRGFGGNHFPQMGFGAIAPTKDMDLKVEYYGGVPNRVLGVLIGGTRLYFNIFKVCTALKISFPGREFLL
jgi:hypothetical protein